MRTLSIDIGNSRCHYAFVEGRTVGPVEAFATKDLIANDNPLRPLLAELVETGGVKVAYASVVPEATRQLEDLLQAAGVKKPFHLTCESVRGLKITYPLPREIGEDRLADSIAGQTVAGAPVIVIDCGSAIVFDVVTAEGGYEGGIIAPGISLMARYLHEKTALLPLLDPRRISALAPFGRSTLEAMELGCLLGSAGLVERLTMKVLEAFGGEADEVPVLITGGDAEVLHPHLGERFQWVPNLTLMGIAEAGRRFWEETNET
jgi:type III pantothenate kinase